MIYHQFQHGEYPWFQCSICGATRQVDPPHGIGEPCPLKVRESDATVAKLDAERMSYIRTGSSTSDMVSILEQMLSSLPGHGDDD